MHLEAERGPGDHLAGLAPWGHRVTACQLALPRPALRGGVPCFEQTERAHDGVETATRFKGKLGVLSSP